jgi:hypothetical protein
MKPLAYSVFALRGCSPCESFKACLNELQGGFEINKHPGKGGGISTDIHVGQEEIGVAV